MSIVFAAVVPHSPLLIPSIAREHSPLLEPTTKQLHLLAGELYAAKPDALIVLTPHGTVYPETIVVHSAGHYQGNFTSFGDLRLTISAPGAPGLIHQLKTVAERAHLPLVLRTFPDLDYGTSVPLHFFQFALPTLPVVPIFVDSQPTELLLRFGSVLHDFCTSSHDRYALIASADLSRRTSKQSQPVQKPTAEERQLSAAITAVDISQASAITPDHKTCGYAPITTLLGALAHHASVGIIHSFDAPLGVGLLTASFRFGP